MISKIKLLTSALLILLVNSYVYAAPSGGNVVHGNANIIQNGSNTVINQNSNSAIINWGSFDINKGESVHFNQLSSSSVVLNRVTNGLPTNILGSLTANGNVFVLNQAGVLIGNGATINTNSFLAGAANINDNDFIAGKYNFYGAQGSVINNGNIKVQNGGYAVLLGKNVENNGLISAKLGKIYLSSGEAYRLDMSGNDLIGIYIEKGSDSAFTSNTGKLHAEGGTIVMTAKNASNIIRQAVNNTGVVDASSISYEGGKVILGAENGEIINNGEINVSSQTNSAGDVDINAENIVNNGTIKANGLNGGSIDLYANSFLQLKDNTIIEANAFGYGNGGNIYLISPNRAEAYKGALIQANSIYGKGGFIELSGYKSVYSFGDFYTKSLYGTYGKFLLDPSNMYIGYYTNLTDEENNVVSGDGNTYIDITWLNNQLKSNDVELKSLSGSGSGNITLNAGVSINGTNGLTLNADNKINLLGDIKVGNLSLFANGDITGNNAITTGNIEVKSYNGNIQLTKLNITGKSIFVAEQGSVSLVGDNFGSINNIKGKNVGIESTGTGVIKGDTTVTDRAVITGDDIVLKSASSIDVTIDTKQLIAEGIGALNITNNNTGETILLKYFGGEASTYTQDMGTINLSYIPENAIGSSGLTINSVYGKIFAQDRLESLKTYANLTMNSNLIHFIETADKTLVIDDSLIFGSASKYIFDNIGDVSVELSNDISVGINSNVTTPILYNSGLEVISRNGAITTKNDINAMYFSAYANKDITASSMFLGGASFESQTGNITFTHKGGPLKISGLKALNGNISIDMSMAGNLFISGLASNNPVKLNAAGAEIISISGTGETALNIDLNNSINSNKYKLSLRNDKDITINNTGNTFTDLIINSNGNINLTGITDGIITADKTISIEGNSINNNQDMALTGTEVYINLKSGTQNYEISADKVDLNGNNLNVTLLKDTQLADVNLDKSSGNIYGTLNITTDKNITLDGKVDMANLNIKALGFDFGSNYSMMNGGNINITTTNDITGIGRVTAYRVDLTGNTISVNSPLIINANVANFSSTATDKTPSDVLININTNDWIYGYKNYVFKTSGPGVSYIAGRQIDYNSSQQFQESMIRSVMPIEITNIDMVSGDDLVNNGKLLDATDLITVEKYTPSKVKSIKRRNRAIEIR